MAGAKSFGGTLAKDMSIKQEKEIAKQLGGKVQAASGGTAFGGGDIHTRDFFIEAKTASYHRTTMQVKEEWLQKMEKQAFEQRKPYSALAIRFDPEGQDYFMISQSLMRTLVEFLEDRGE